MSGFVFADTVRSSYTRWGGGGGRGGGVVAGRDQSWAFSLMVARHHCVVLT